MCTQTISPITCILHFAFEVTELFWTPCLNLFASHVSTRFSTKKHGPLKTSESIHSSEGHTARPPIGLRRGKLGATTLWPGLYFKTEGDSLIPHTSLMSFASFGSFSGDSLIRNRSSSEVVWRPLMFLPSNGAPVPQCFSLLNAYQMYQGYQGHLHCEVATNANLSINERLRHIWGGFLMIALIALFEGSHSPKNRNNTSTLRWSLGNASR